VGAGGAGTGHQPSDVKYLFSFQALGFYLTQCIYQLGVESQLLRKTVDLIYQKVMINSRLTILWESQ